MADDARPGARAGGAWLTYRYRLGAPGVAESAGTIKAPSFATAARRILARAAERGGGEALGAGPVFLRLRAAGEEEVLLRAVRADAGAHAPWHVEPAPAGAHRFAAPDATPNGDGAPGPPA